MTSAPVGSILDYVGRTVDLLALQGQAPAGEKLLVQTLALPGEGGRICTGVQKLVQRVALEFLTDTRTLRYLPTRGCDFTGQARRGELRTALDAEQAFYLAAHQVKSNLQAEEDDDTPEDEAFGTFTLDAIVVTADKLVVRATVTSVAGETAAAILPVTVRNG